MQISLLTLNQEVQSRLLVDKDTEKKRLNFDTSSIEEVTKVKPLLLRGEKHENSY